MTAVPRQRFPVPWSGEKRLGRLAGILCCGDMNDGTGSVTVFLALGRKGRDRSSLRTKAEAAEGIKGHE